MALDIYNIKRWIRMVAGVSTEHVNQGMGTVYSLTGVKGYYNDLTGKVRGTSARLPMHRTARGSTVYFPIQIFQYGLGAYDMYLMHGGVDMKKRFKMCADWALHEQQPDGGWNCFFFDTPKAPFSAMAQGEGISLLIRAFVEYKDQAYLEAARKAVKFMLRPIRQGGTARYDGRYVYFREFTNKPEVLNGWIFSLFGLYDYLKVMPDEQVRDAYMRSVVTLAVSLRAFDCSFWSKYDSRTKIASPFYHRLHIALLCVMQKITGMEVYREYADKWHIYEKRFFGKSKAFIVKAWQKLREKRGTKNKRQNLKVMQILPEFELAGAEIMAENLCITLRQNDVDVCAVSLYSKHTEITGRLMQNRIPIFFLKKGHGADPIVMLRLYRLFRREKPNVVHSHRYILPYVLPAAVMAGVRVRVHTVHSVAAKEVDKIHRAVSRFCYGCGVVPVAISSRIKQTIMEDYGFSDEKVPVVMNGIDQRSIIPKHSYLIYKDNVRLLHIGRFSMEKNHDGLIDIFRLVQSQYSGVRLILIGTGSLENDIKQKVQDLGLSEYVSFEGITQDVTPYLNSADIFVLPSLWEGMPIVLIEAMAAGLPIVASRVGGVPDMIDDVETGLLCSADAQVFAQNVLTLIESEELRKKLGSGAVRAAQRFSAQQMAKGYLHIYNNELRKKE